MTEDEPRQPPPSRRLASIAPLLFIVMVIVGLIVAAIPLESMSEVSSGGGAAKYCKAESAPYLPGSRNNPKVGMIQCSGDRPYYFAALPLYIAGGAFAALGLLGLFGHAVETVEIRRSAVRD